MIQCIITFYHTPNLGIKLKKLLNEIVKIVPSKSTPSAFCLVFTIELSEFELYDFRII